MNNKELPFASVIICTQNRKEYLQNYSLRTALELAYPRYEVIVVVDGSQDSTDDFLASLQGRTANLKVVRHPIPRGVAYARQAGVQRAAGQIIAFTDDDCMLEKNWLKELVLMYLEDNELMAAGGLTYEADTDKPCSSPEDIFGFNMSFRRAVFDRFSFDANLFFHRAPMHEETDLIARMRHHGYKTGYTRKAIVRHFPASASYRRINKRIGDHLNWIYMKAKATSLPRYYCAFFKRSRQMYSKIKDLHRDGVISFLDTWRKLAWVNYVLLFELPVKAKIAHRQEEKKLKT
ncbi:MAG TPA: glycosyltransferase family A protein [Patescibacteria group bacterium]|nr:glycosyltransferase family A protein [Patescibacteria group bacterium]